MLFEKRIKINTCSHIDELAVYCQAPHNIALCNDCYFEQQDVYGKKGQTLKKASSEQITQMEQINLQIIEAVKTC
jgi:hypothetical protein